MPGSMYYSTDPTRSKEREGSASVRHNPNCLLVRELFRERPTQMRLLLNKKGSVQNRNRRLLIGAGTPGIRFRPMVVAAIIYEYARHLHRRYCNRPRGEKIQHWEFFRQFIKKMVYRT